MSAAFIRLLCCLALIISTLSAARAADPKPGRDALAAARYALAGKNKDDVKVMDHGFNIYAATIKQVGDVTTITGRIAHRLRLRKDDQVYYTIKKVGDKAPRITIEIDRGGLSSYVGKAVGFLSRNPVSGEELGEWLGKATAYLGHDWEDAAELIVVAIALKANARPYVPGNNRPDAPAPTPPAPKLPRAEVLDAHKAQLNLGLQKK
jgi:hypothetical protein